MMTTRQLQKRVREVQASMFADDEDTLLAAMDMETGRVYRVRAFSAPGDVRPLTFEGSTTLLGITLQHQPLSQKPKTGNERE